MIDHSKKSENGFFHDIPTTGFDLAITCFTGENSYHYTIAPLCLIMPFITKPFNSDEHNVNDNFVIILFDVFILCDYHFLLSQIMAFLSFSCNTQRPNIFGTNLSFFAETY